MTSSCSTDRQGPKFRLIAQVASKLFRLELKRGQICTKLNPCASFGVRDKAMKDYADVRVHFKYLPPWLADLR